MLYFWNIVVYCRMCSGIIEGCWGYFIFWRHKWCHKSVDQTLKRRDSDYQSVSLNIISFLSILTHNRCMHENCIACPIILSFKEKELKCLHLDCILHSCKDELCSSFIVSFSITVIWDCSVFTDRIWRFWADIKSALLYTK